MADHKIAIANTLRIEGAYQQFTWDRGNFVCNSVTNPWPNIARVNGNFVCGSDNVPATLVGTNYGISAAALTMYTGKVATESQMRGLAQKTAEDIYKKEYWDVILGNKIINQDIANSFFDHAVNRGPQTAISVMQKALNILGATNTLGNPLSVDGICGTNTINAINSLDQAAVNNQFLDARQKDYQEAAGGAIVTPWDGRLQQFPPLTGPIPAPVPKPSITTTAVGVADDQVRAVAAPTAVAIKSTGVVTESPDTDIKRNVKWGYYVFGSIIGIALILLIVHLVRTR